jgi:integrase
MEGIDFESLVIEIREGYARSQVTKLKSECSRDELPLDPDVATILLKWKRLCPATEGDWVFHSPRRKRKANTSVVQRVLVQDHTK